MPDVRGWYEAGAPVLVAGVLLGLATASGPLFVSSAGTAMVAAELASVEDEPALLSVRGSGAVTAADVATADAAVTEHLDRAGLPRPHRELVIEATTETGARVNLIGPDADALGQLPEIRVPGAGGPAVTVSDAARLGIDAGDRLAVAASPRADAVTIPIGPIVDEFDRDAMPPAWRGVTGLVAPPDDPRLAPPPPALLMDHGRALTLLHELTGSTPDDASEALVRASWVVGLDTPMTLEGLEALIPRLEGVRVELADPTSDVGATLAGANWTPPIVGGRSSDAAVARVADARDDLATPVALLTAGGQLLALGATGLAVVIGSRRQHARARLWRVRGVPVVRLALRSTAMAAVPLALGMLIGGAAAVAAIRASGPSGAADAGVEQAVWLRLALTGLVAMATVSVATGVTARRPGGGSPSPRRVPPVAEALLATTAGLALWQARSNAGPVAADAGGRPVLDLLTWVLPVVLVLAVTAVGTRLLGLLLRLSSRARTHRVRWFLVSRRLGLLGGSTMALVFTTASAIGLYTLAATLEVSSEATVREKAGVALGADAVLSLPRSSLADGVDVDAIPGPTTRVRRASEIRLDDGSLVDVLAIDPTAFADVAYETRHLAEVDLEGLVAPLAGVPADDRDATLPAIVVGAPLRETVTASIAHLSLDVAPIATTPVFPGVTGERPGLVVPDTGPLAPDDVAVTARLGYTLSPELWVRGDDPGQRRVLDSLAQAGAPPATAGGRRASSFSYASDRADDPAVAPLRWTYTFLRVQAGSVAAIAGLALLGHHLLRQRRGALATSLASRMGLRRSLRATGELVELATLAGSAVVVGAIAGVAAARSVLGHYDPVPDIALPIVFRVPTAVVAAPLLAACLAVVIAVPVTMRAVDRIPEARLLRGEP